MGFLVTLILKERRKIEDLKLFENQGAIKIIWKTEIWQLEFWKLIENCNFENWSFLKINWKLEFWKLFEN